MTAEAERARTDSDTVLVRYRSQPEPDENVRRIVAAAEAAEPRADLAWIHVISEDEAHAYLGSGEHGRTSGGNLLILQRDAGEWSVVRRSQWVE